MSESCSTTCGTGVEKLTRTCVRNENQHECLGVRFTTKTQPCSRPACSAQLSGLRCYECRNSVSNDDCLRRGKLSQCFANQVSFFINDTLYCICAIQYASLLRLQYLNIYPILRNLNYFLNCIYPSCSLSTLLPPLVAPNGGHF